MRALEFQTAIKEQLAERERHRLAEREQRARDERRHEELLQRQLEAERNAFEVQVRQQREQHEAEQRRQETMRAALQRAEEEARAEREKRKRERGLVLAAAAAEKAAAEERSAVTAAGKKDEEERKEYLDNGMYVEKSLNKKNVTETAKLDEKNFLIGSPINMRKPMLLQSSVKPKTTPFDEREEIPINVKQSETPDEIQITSNPASAPPPSGFVSVPMPANAVISLNNLQFAVMLAHQIEQLAPPNLLAKLQTNSTSNVANNDATELRAGRVDGLDNITNNVVVATMMLCDSCQSKPASAATSSSSSASASSEGRQMLTTAVAELAIEATESMICPNENPPVACAKLPHDGTFTKESSAATDAVRTMDRGTQTEQRMPKEMMSGNACETCSVTMEEESKLADDSIPLSVADAEIYDNLEVIYIYIVILIRVWRWFHLKIHFSLCAAGNTEHTAHTNVDHKSFRITDSLRNDPTQR